MPILSLKSGVDVSRIRPELVLVCSIISSIFIRAGYDCVITSISDGVHGSGSRHYVGLAADFRIRHIDSKITIDTLVDIIRRSLGVDYDVVLEADHIHVEYDPKKVH